MHASHRRPTASLRAFWLVVSLGLALAAASRSPAAAQHEPEPQPEDPGLPAQPPAPGFTADEPAPEAPPEDPGLPANVPGRAAVEAATPPPTDPAPMVLQLDAPEGPRITGTPGQGLTVRVGEAFSLNLRTRFVIRYLLNIPPENEAGERELEQLVNIGTARLWISGHVFRPELTYMIQLAVAARDYRDGTTSPIFDAYLDWKAHRDLSVRAGQYFVPFDRLRTVREWALQMADRPQPVNELTLDRDVGVTLYSDNFLADDSPLAWRLSAFGGGGTNLTQGREPGGLVLGRVELRPLGPIDDDREGDLARREKPALALGAALGNNWNTNRVRSTTGPTFEGGTTDFFHAATDLVFKWRGFALQAEYLWKRASSDIIASTDAMGMPRIEPTRSAHGYVLQGSYVFDPPLEVVGRFTRLFPYAGTDPRYVTQLRERGQEVGVGLNYYFNQHWFKLQANWIARMPHGTELALADHLVHVQLDATF